MTDRELLELAGKAAGVYYRPQYDLVKTRIGWDTWNPLTDDGDALRLAVKLGILVSITGPAYAEAMRDEVHAIEHTGLDLSGCIYSATRRAIVRAAAEIGKGMQ